MSHRPSDLKTPPRKKGKQAEVPPTPGQKHKRQQVEAEEAEEDDADAEDEGTDSQHR